LRSYFKSIYEIPIWAWFKLKETDNLAYLKKSNLKKSPKEHDFSFAAFTAYSRICDQFINEFGLPSEVKKQISIKKRLAKALYKYCMTGNKRYLTDIELYKEDLRELIGDVITRHDYFKEASNAGKALGRGFDMFKTNLYQYIIDTKTLLNGNG